MTPNPCPKCGETKYLGLNQYARLNGPSTYQLHCLRCKFHGPEMHSQDAAQEAWDADPNGRFTQLSLLA